MYGSIFMRVTIWLDLLGMDYEQIFERAARL